MSIEQHLYTQGSEQKGGERSRDPKYKIFTSARSRNELYSLCKGLAAYVEREKIGNVIFLDKSARPLALAVMQYQRLTGSREEGRPRIYFMNPRGFLHAGSPSHVVRDEMDEASYKGDRRESERSLKTKFLIDDEVRSKYPELYSERGNPVLILDTCVHTGSSANRVIEALTRNGFSDVRFGVGHKGEYASLSPDLELHSEEPVRMCRPFGNETLVQKTFEHIHAIPSDDEKAKRQGRALREEIARVISTQFKRENKA